MERKIINTVLLLHAPNTNCQVCKDLWIWFEFRPWLQKRLPSTNSIQTTQLGSNLLIPELVDKLANMPKPIKWLSKCCQWGSWVHLTARPESFAAKAGREANQDQKSETEKRGGKWLFDPVGHGEVEARGGKDYRASGSLKGVCNKTKDA